MLPLITGEMSNPHSHCLLLSPFCIPRSLSPALQPNSFAKHNRAGWKWSRLATRTLPLGCGALPAVCYTVALDGLKKGVQLSCSHLLQLVGWWSAQRRLIETLSHEEKEVIFFFPYMSALTLSVSPPRLSFPSLRPSLPTLRSPHQHNSRQYF